jgi:hypothetical protein
MQDISIELEAGREKLRDEKCSQWDCHILGVHLEQLASMFQRTSRDEHRDLIAQFHNYAGKLPYVLDQDFGALVLEVAADGIDDKDLQAWVLTEARFRATWCAQAGTAGGECLARYQHVKRLDEKLIFSSVSRANKP